MRQADLLQASGALLPALSAYDAALATVRRLRYGYGLLGCGGNRSYTLFALGRTAEALDSLRELRPELPSGLQCPLFSILAITLSACGQDDAAREAAFEGLGGTLTIGLSATLARTIEALALLHARAGDTRAAAKLFGFALARHPAERMRLGPRRVVFEELVALLGVGSPDCTAGSLLAMGAAWSEEEALAAVRSGEVRTSA